MAIDAIYSTTAPAPMVGIYSQAVRAGNLVFVSGVIGESSDGASIIGGEIGGRTRQIIKNVEHVLEGAGLTLRDIVKATIFLPNLSDNIDAVNRVWTELMPEPKPARTCIGVKELPLGTDVEIEFVAYDSRRRA